MNFAEKLSLVIMICVAPFLTNETQSTTAMIVILVFALIFWIAGEEER